MRTRTVPTASARARAAPPAPSLPPVTTRTSRARSRPASPRPRLRRAATVPPSFSGSVADNAGGVGLNANSAIFTLQRASDSNYWNGSSWQASAFNLATTHSATTGNTAATWTSSAAIPNWSSEPDSTYTVQATATDKVGNSFTGTAISFTLDSTTPVTASVTTPADGTLYNGSTAPTIFSGSAADNTGGSGLSTNTVTFTFQRSNGDYWNGSAWQSGVSNRPTTHVATTGGTAASWTSSALGNWLGNVGTTDGTY